MFGQQTLSFKDCLNLAFKNNLLLKENIILQEMSVYDLKRSKANLLPNLNGYGDKRYSSGRDIDPRTNQFINQNINAYTGNLTSMFTLFSGFLNLNLIKSAKQQVDINKANIQKIKNDITIDLAYKYIVITYLQDIILANTEQITSSEKQLEMANLKYQSGTIAQSEVFKIQSQKASEELTLTSNQNQLALNLIDLKQLMNLPVETEIKLEKPSFIVEELNLSEENQYSLTKKAIVIQPSYIMSQINEKKAKIDIDVERAARYPIINLRFQYLSNYSDSDKSLNFTDQVNVNAAYNFRLSITVPIFNQFETNYRIKQSKLNYEKSKINMWMEENRISKVVLQAVNDTKTAKKKQEMSTAAYEFAKKSFETDQLKFEAGKININELNFTKINYINAQAELIRAKYEYIFNKALVNFYRGKEFFL
jgi:outer membrane protein